MGASNNLYCMIGIIYLITNKINSKVYVGQTICSLDKRWKEHLRGNGQCRALSSAIKKHGKVNFNIQIIESIEDEERSCLIDKLDTLERVYIKTYNSLSPNGYNLTSGGHTARLSLESVDKRANSCKKPIICTSTGQVFQSTTDAAKILGLNKKSIHRVLRGERRQYHGLTFEYVSKHKPLSVENAEWKKSKKPRKNAPFICHQNGKIYNKLTEACLDLDLSVSKLSLVLNGKRKSHKKLTFSYLPQSY